MRHFTLASLLATALALGMLTATPSMAQATQPAAKSDSKMAPAPKAVEDAPAVEDGAGAEGRAARHQLGDRRSTRRAAGHRQGLFGQDHRGPPVQGQGRAGAKSIVPQATYDKIKDKIIAKQKS